MPAPPPLPWLANEHIPLPPPHQAWGAGTPAPGLLAAGGDLSINRLEQAYRQGTFPWFGPHEPVLWWCTHPRMVLRPQGFRLHRSLRQAVRRFMMNPACAIHFNRDFPAVMHACAQTLRNGQQGTWIVPEIIQAYTLWHKMGRVQSVETWVDGQLVGGLYGVSIGRMFFGESMFSHQTDASKLALAALVGFALENGIGLIDCQQQTAHLQSLGGTSVSRDYFLEECSKRCAQPDIPLPWVFSQACWLTLLAQHTPASR
jgi:leucyl/phenylalanyl-tRNA--protein transferase